MKYELKYLNNWKKWRSDVTELDEPDFTDSDSDML